MKLWAGAQEGVDDGLELGSARTPPAFPGSNWSHNPDSENLSYWLIWIHGYMHHRGVSVYKMWNEQKLSDIAVRHSHIYDIHINYFRIYDSCICILLSHIWLSHIWLSHIWLSHIWFSHEWLSHIWHSHIRTTPLMCGMRSDEYSCGCMWRSIYISMKANIERWWMAHNTFIPVYHNDGIDAVE